VALAFSLTIPYFKIFSVDEESIKNYMNSDGAKSVYLKVDLGLNNPDNRVEYELWYGSILDLS